MISIGAQPITSIIRARSAREMPTQARANCRRPHKSHGSDDRACLNMKTRLTFTLLLVAVMLDAASVQCQSSTIQTETGKQTVLARADLEALPHSRVTTGAPDSPVTYDVVTLKTLLEKAGITFHKLSGKRLAACLLVEAADGYRVVIALPEIDPAFTNKQILLAFLRDGKPLDEKQGPYRIVIPDEKRMARSVRQVTTLKIVDVQ
jgi:hypothetical protein